MKKILGAFILVACLCNNPLEGQITTGEVTGQVNVIQSMVPFLTIAPDSRSGGMGDIGAATSPDVFSQHWNPAKYAFIDGDGGMGMAYSPWLRNLVPDINLAYLSTYYRLDDKQVISGSLLYFSLGNIVFTNIWAGVERDFNPNEFAIDLAYSRLLSDHLSGGISFRYIYSNLTGGYSPSGVETKAGKTLAADVSVYYKNKIEVSDKDADLSFGLNISNIGDKMTYTDDKDPEFIPINLRLGSALKLELDQYNSLTLAADVNKLLVPTPPIYYQDSLDLSGNRVIRAGMDPNVSIPVGMIQSFYDAPGGFKEEIREITYSLGVEYWYSGQFALRAGYFHEHETKGNRKFFTAGAGLKLNIFALDVSYLMPVAQNHPLARTLRFSLSFDLNAFKNIRS